MQRVDELIYTKLKENQTINTLTGGRISNIVNHSGGLYPSVTFSEISNVPALSADNAEVNTRITVQITILYKKDNINALAQEIETVLLDNGFIRQSYHDFNEHGISNKAMRFIYLT